MASKEKEDRLTDVNQQRVTESRADLGAHQQVILKI